MLNRKEVYIRPANSQEFAFQSIDLLSQLTSKHNSIPHFLKPIPTTKMRFLIVASALLASAVMAAPEPKQAEAKAVWEWSCLPESCQQYGVSSHSAYTPTSSLAQRLS